MTQREKLIELIHESVIWCQPSWAETIADYLLSHGVIVLPCKAGDTVYYPGSFEFAELEVTSITLSRDGNIRLNAVCKNKDCEPDDPCIMPEQVCSGTFSSYDFGRELFLTREEAEAALKEIKEENDK